MSRRKRHESFENELFHRVVDLRAEGLTWKKIATLIDRPKTNMHTATMRHIHKQPPNWILPSLPDQIIEALRNDTKPPGTTKQVIQIRNRPGAQELLHSTDNTD